MSANKVILACAGSRKTSTIIEKALSLTDRRVLITTYTINNTDQKKDRIISIKGYIPKNITVSTWFSFLLSDGARPYQNVCYSKRRIKSIFFVNKKSVPFIGEKEFNKHYFYDSELIYTDKLSKFIIKCNNISSGAVLKRLEDIYDHIFIDEVQDMAGYDFDFIELLMKSDIATTVVGDCRQATYFTNCSPKNRQFKGCRIDDLFKKWGNESLCEVEERNTNFRSNQDICSFADKLYPDLPPSVSKDVPLTGHDGFFFIKHQQKVEEYIEEYNPIVLRWDKRTKVKSDQVMNFGATKGLEFDRVLIYPTNDITMFLKNKAELKPLSKAKFYVALTRARYSVAILLL